METLLLLSVLTWPLQGVITQTPSEKHPAVDISCVKGQTVVASHAGHATSYYDYNLGNTVVVVGSHYVSTYSHLDRATQGKLVVAGDEIGICGNTGKQSTGPHLHYSVYSIE